MTEKGVCYYTWLQLENEVMIKITSLVSYRDFFETLHKRSKNWTKIARKEINFFLIVVLGIATAPTCKFS